MHPSNLILQQQYRQQKFTKYCELLSMMLVAKTNNELLMMNHNMRPTGSIAPPEANVADKGFQYGNPDPYGQQQ